MILTLDFNVDMAKCFKSVY